MKRASIDFFLNDSLSLLVSDHRDPLCFLAGLARINVQQHVPFIRHHARPGIVSWLEGEGDCEAGHLANIRRLGTLPEEDKTGQVGPRKVRLRRRSDELLSSLSFDVHIYSNSSDARAFSFPIRRVCFTA